MHTWAIERRHDLLDAAIEANPFLISISFGSVAPYVERLQLRERSSLLLEGHEAVRKEL